MTRLRVIVVGHLPVHVDPLVRGLSRYCFVSTLFWRPIPIFAKGRAILTVPVLVLRILLRSHAANPDLLLAQYAFPDGFSSVIAALILRIPCGIQVVGSDILIGSRGIKRRLIKWAVSRASGVICVSRQLEALVREMNAANTVVIPSPLDLSDFPQTTDMERAENRLITVAMLTKIKGLDVLLRALEQVYGAELLIVGDGPERQNLELLAKRLRLANRIKFLGLVPHREVWRHMLSSSVFVLPSLSEGLPRALLEAMACGLAIVASEVGGIPEVVRDGWNGRLVRPGNMVAFRSAIEEILTDKGRIKVMRERNKLEAQAYTLEKIAEKQFRFLASLVLGRGG